MAVFSVIYGLNEQIYVPYGSREQRFKQNIIAFYLKTKTFGVLRKINKLSLGEVAQFEVIFQETPLNDVMSFQLCSDYSQPTIEDVLHTKKFKPPTIPRIWTQIETTINHVYANVKYNVNTSSSTNPQSNKSYAQAISDPPSQTYPQTTPRNPVIERSK